MKQLGLIIFSLTFIFNTSSGVNNDSVPENDTMRVSVFRGIDKFYVYRFDSINMIRSLDSLVIYRPDIRKYNYNSSLGNVGSSLFSPFYKNDISLGLRVGTDSRRLFLWEDLDIRFVNSHKRYSRVYYVNGSKKENYIEVEHSQSFGNNLDIGFRYNRINSLGYYTAQQTYYSRLNFYGRLSSRNKRYHLLFNTALNSNKNQENGGISSDAQFEGDSISNLKFLNVNLSNAQSQIKDNSFMVHQHYDFGKKVRSSELEVGSEQPEDSTKINTVFIPKFRLGHEINYRKNFFLYTDNDPLSGFYSDILLDSASTNDSIGVKNLENTLSFNFFGKSMSGLQIPTSGSNYFSRNYLGILVRHQYTDIGYGANQPDTAGISVAVKTLRFINNNAFATLNAGMNGRIINKLWTELSYCITGYNSGDFSGVFGLQKFLNDSSGRAETLEFTVSASSKEPDFITQQYTSNHFVWTNGFSKIFNLEANTVFAFPEWKLKTGGAYNVVNNAVYYRQDATPAQFGSGINIIKVFVQKRFTLGKFNLDNDVTYQYVKKDLPIRLPEVVLRSSFFFEAKLFKKALHSRFGVDLYYNTAWKTYSYMPATGQFYLQDGNVYGNYPYLDVYAAFRVKGARFFFKLDHAFAGLLGNTYYGAAHYPLNGRTFKFGIDWRFLD